MIGKLCKGLRGSDWLFRWWMGMLVEGIVNTIGFYFGRKVEGSFLF